MTKVLIYIYITAHPSVGIIPHLLHSRTKNTKKWRRTYRNPPPNIPPLTPPPLFPITQQRDTPPLSTSKPDTTIPAAQAARPNDLADGIIGEREIDHRMRGGIATGPRRSIRLPTGRGQSTIRPEPGPGLQRGGSQREHPAGGRGGPVVRRQRLRRHHQFHLALPRRSEAGPTHL